MAELDPPVGEFVHPTLPLLPSHPPGFSIEAQLALTSNEWLTPLHRDVNVLLSIFEWRWLTSDAADLKLSAFELFKLCWQQQGWANAHLIAIVDGPNRAHWTQSVMRAFLDRINADEPAFNQLAAVFAVYTLFLTQPASAVQVHVAVSASHLEYISSLPAQLSEAFASSRPQPLPQAEARPDRKAPPAPNAEPALDLHYIILTLFKRKAFFIVPEETIVKASDLPLTRVVDSSEVERIEAAKTAIAIEREMNRRGGQQEWGTGVHDAGAAYYNSKLTELNGLANNGTAETIFAEAEQLTTQAMTRNGGGTGLEDGSGGDSLMNLVPDRLGAVAQALEELGEEGGE